MGSHSDIKLVQIWSGVRFVLKAALIQTVKMIVFIG